MMNNILFCEEKSIEKKLRQPDGIKKKLKQFKSRIRKKFTDFFQRNNRETCAN